MSAVWPLPPLPINDSPFSSVKTHAHRIFRENHFCLRVPTPAPNHPVTLCNDATYRFFVVVVIFFFFYINSSLCGGLVKPNRNSGLLSYRDSFFPLVGTIAGIFTSCLHFLLLLFLFNSFLSL